MNFKRILAGVMAGATAISLAACSNSVFSYERKFCQFFEKIFGKMFANR